MRRRWVRVLVAVVECSALWLLLKVFYDAMADLVGPERWSMIFAVGLLVVIVGGIALLAVSEIRRLKRESEEDR
ncbi:hypothetical protein [Actinokineospora sp. NBRC 105648]|uniref:hypothetical protein n=1 Tax=Actinokineospora sp. NBRC 105648 TaxID=3032206 RepID=UPI0024A531E8|nr:hypothetical protein [Actinokineospora sp. NBRC 105648]GLZ42482.1 hypothetical protein Acsp05_61060 [Actinokineospora sp. NBRC 105648]